MKYLLILIGVIFISSCEKEEALSSVTNGDVIIGTYAGECFGECATFFLLRDNQIFGDEFEVFQNQTLEFSTNPLVVDEASIERFLDIAQNVPEILLDSSQDIYGCPDCGDWGAIHFEMSGRSWTLDNLNENNPQEIRSFVTEIQKLILVLRN